MRGGLNTEAPPIAVPDGQLIACENYEPDVAGYTSFSGYERFDGRPKPSEAADATDREARRAAIQQVPGKGPVLAAWSVTDAAGDSHYAIRENSGDTNSTLYRASASGWSAVTPNPVIYFNEGAGTSGSPLEGEWVRTSGGGGGVAKIERVILLKGTYSGGDARGYLCLSSYTGDFGSFDDDLEFSKDNSFAGSPLYAPAAKFAKADPRYGMIHGFDEGTEGNGGALQSTFAPPITVTRSIVVRSHIFRSGLGTERSYFSTGGRFAFEFDGNVLCPIRTGAPDYDILSAAIGGDLDGLTEEQAISAGLVPAFENTAIYREHLFLASRLGTLLNSAPNDPLDFKAISGAAEIGFGTSIAGFQSEVSGVLIIYGLDRVSYLTGSSDLDFSVESILREVTPRGKTMQLAGAPIFMDRTGVRRLATTEAFGNWRVSTLTAQYESFFRSAFASGISPVASMRVNEKDIYRVFFDNGDAISLYFGRNGVEIGRLSLPITLSTASGTFSASTDEIRLVGAEDGYVYQMDVGGSMDGERIYSAIAMAPYSARAPRTNKRFVTAALEVTGGAVDSIKFRAEFDYSAPTAIPVDLPPNPVAGGGALWGAVNWDEFVWSDQSVATAIARLDSAGVNILMTIAAESAFQAPHTLTAITYNMIYRNVKRV